MYRPLGPEGVSLLERCPHFRGCYVEASMAEDVSLLERCPHFRLLHAVDRDFNPQWDKDHITQH